MSRATAIDLNADVGEGCGHDPELIPLVSSVNIACGAHAGRSVEHGGAGLALRSGASIGAHPGFADREHFGRREIPVEPAEARILVAEQIGALRRMALSKGARVGHVKLHGALYNMASRDRALALAVVDAVAEDGRRAGRGLVLVALAGSLLQSLGRSAGLRVVGEAFADRAYRPTDRSCPGRSRAR